MQDRCYLSQIHGKDQEFRHQGVEFICRKLLNPGAFFFLYKFIYLFIWLCWVFVSVRGLSPVVASGGHSSSPCAGLSPSRPLPLQSTSPRRAGSAVVAHGPSRSAACGILPDQGSNPCPLHWQADSQPLRHQGSPPGAFYVISIKLLRFPSLPFCEWCFLFCNFTISCNFKYIGMNLIII